jgi:predicted Zn-dependent protease
MKEEKKNHRQHINIFILAIIFTSVFLWVNAKPANVIGMSIEEEKDLGRRYLVELKQHVQLADDAFIEEYINDLGNYLVQSLETKPFDFNFYVIADNQINAFATPGGHIFIYTGLIELTENIDELAGVMCHEIAHVSLRHISDRIEKAKKVGLATMAGLLLGAMIGGDAADALITGSVAAGQQKMLSYSREDERQADQIGFTYANKAGFDPSAMISTLTKLQQDQWGIHEIPPYLLTHPLGPERMSNIEALLGSFPPFSEHKEATKSLRRLFPLFKTILKGKFLYAHEAEQVFRTELEKDPDSPSAHLGLGLVLKRQTEYDNAIDHFLQALDGLPDPLPALRYLSETYQLKRQDREAIRVLEKALTLNHGTDKTCLFLLANSYQNLEQYPRAAEIYERLASMEPVKDEVFYSLGMTYGKDGKLGLAHYNFGIYHRRLNHIEESRFHFQKAEELAGDDSALQQKIKQAMEEIDKKKPAPPKGEDQSIS